PALTVEEAARDDAGTVRVSGQVEHASLLPTADGPTASTDDPGDDATTPLTEVLGRDVEVPDTDVVGTLHLAQVPPVSAGGSVTSYSLVVDGTPFDSYVPLGGAEPVIL